MLVDARTVAQDGSIEADVCIIGAGAAGVTLAREFIGQPFNVCLLESGGLNYEAQTQALYQGKTSGLPYTPLDACRLRYFGGSTNHWGGLCRPLDEMDFEARPWIPHSGWPFGKAELDPFYRRAQSICQLGPYAYEVAAWQSKERPPLPLVGDRMVSRVFQNSPPTRFGQAYREEIRRAPNIRTLLHANVVNIETNATASAVTRLRVASLDGKRFWVRARQFILATGGIENARLLLLSNQVQRTGLGNQHDLVGRYFADHVYLFSRNVVALSNPRLPTGLYETHTVRKTPVVAYLTPTPSALRRERLANYSLWLYPQFWSKYSEGIGSFRAILKDLRHGRLTEDFGQHVANVMTDLDGVAGAIYRRLFGPLQLKLEYCAELEPNPDNRVSLSHERDNLGQQRVQLHFRMSERDQLNMQRGVRLLGLEVGRAGLGRMKLDEDADNPLWLQAMRFGDHNMGTTRMHQDPRRGVVDADCRVHGISNLYIAGSSVFPTYGHANPTFTIVALAVRLADHVKRVMA
ncbi:MAG: FAD-dependent oxidoreductase [Pseudomonadota bacterium]